MSSRLIPFRFLLIVYPSFDVAESASITWIEDGVGRIMSSSLLMLLYPLNSQKISEVFSG